MRHSYSGYTPNQETRQSYGMTEADEGSVQQHTWFRKLETQAGRWTGPDPYKGSMSLSNPQSFNRYGYVENDPINYVDPSGLIPQCLIQSTEIYDPARCWVTVEGRGSTILGGSGVLSDLIGDSDKFSKCVGGSCGGAGGEDSGEEGDNEDECLGKLNAVLKNLLGEKSFNKLKNNQTNTTGIEALWANFVESDRVRTTIGTNSSYNTGTKLITINIDPLRTEWGIRLDVIHELLHGARSSSFSHRDIYRAMSQIDGLDFNKFSKDRRRQLKAQGAKIYDDSIYRDAMNAWIRKYCE